MGLLTSACVAGLTGDDLDAYGQLPLDCRDSYAKLAAEYRRRKQAGDYTHALMKIAIDSAGGSLTNRNCDVAKDLRVIKEAYCPPEVQIWLR